MVDILITFLTFVMIIITLIMVVAILMQRGSSQGGLGAAFGGGMAESAFGAETTNVLTKATRWTAFAFFGISLLLYLLYISDVEVEEAVEEEALPTFEQPVEEDASGLLEFTPSSDSVVTETLPDGTTVATSSASGAAVSLEVDGDLATDPVEVPAEAAGAADAIPAESSLPDQPVNPETGSGQ